MEYDNQWYDEESKRFWQTHKDEIHRIFQWKENELEHDFLGFLHVYAPYVNIPKDFVILDLGCYTGIQAAYFAEHAAYIGVDIDVPKEWRFQQPNVISFKQSIQDFIQQTLPQMDIDLNRCFAICSYVPDKEAQYMVAETFPYHKVVYCDEIISEQLPEDLLEEVR